MTRPLPPAGISLVADRSLRRVGGGSVLIGGAPLRIVRLAPAGGAVVDAWFDGAVLADVKSARALAGRLLDAGIVHPVVGRAPSPPPVTVVVPVRDDPAGLDRLLGSIGSTARAVVVDDASTDPVAHADVAAAHGATLVRRPAGGGPGAARMDGLAEVATELVAFVDADVELSPDWWTRLARHFDDPGVGAVAPRVRSRPGPSLREHYEAAHSPLDLGPAPAIVGPRRPVSYVPTAALVVRRALLDDVGGFDPGLRHGEDVDLVWRLVRAGHTVRYDPAVEVAHRPRATWAAWVRQRHAYGASAAPLAARHGVEVAPARCSPWSAAAWASAALGRPGLGLVIASGSSAALVPKLSALPRPVVESARLAGLGHLHAGLGLARAVSRVWWPLALPLCTVSRRARWVTAAAVTAPAVRAWVTGARPTDPVRSIALRVLDDLAYGAGVWTGVARHRDLAAVRPDLVDWPGGRAAVEADTVRP